MNFGITLDKLKDFFFFLRRGYVVKRKEKRRKERTGIFSRNPQMFRKKTKVSKNWIYDQSPKSLNPQISLNKNSGKYKLTVK